MRVIIVGLGIQGQKRRAVAGDAVVATVDPAHADADYKALEAVPLDRYDAALLCIPDEPKIALLTYLLKNRKHALVEKPLFAATSDEISALAGLAEAEGLACYTAYNHRFEPHFVRLRDLIASGDLGRLYHVRLFYGNGTARDVRGSPWRDCGAGVLPDLGSHLLDTLRFWFGPDLGALRVISCDRHENRAFDHIVVGSDGAPPAGQPRLELEMTLLSWRNHFVCDLYGEHGSAHIESLCKWGPSRFAHRRRKLPSGRPDEESVTLVQPDPTWELEYAHFRALCETGGHNLDSDLWLNDRLTALGREALTMAPESRS